MPDNYISITPMVVTGKFSGDSIGITPSIDSGVLLDVGGVPGAERCGSAADGLGNYTSNFSPPRPRKTGGQVLADLDRRHQKRRQRYDLRHRMRPLTMLERVTKCGRVSITGEGSGPMLRVGEGGKGGGRVAGFAGLARCGSVWACPVCSAKIATRRADDLSDMMRWALEQGCSASMVTMTMRHHKGQTLKECWDALGYAWHRVTSGKQWITDKSAAGLQGWVKAVEVTNGKNGWHVHVHVLMVWKSKISTDMAEHVGGRMHARWTRALQRKGFDSWRDSGGLDVRLASLKPGKTSGLHEYFVKLSHEITGGQQKKANGNGRTPFQLLLDGLDTGLADDLERWLEWEHASKGRRQIAWSKGLREWAKLMPEQSDEEIAQEELDGEDVLAIEPASWRVLREKPDRMCKLLEVTESGGLPRAASLLDDWGYAWTPVYIAPKPPPEPPRPTARAEALLAEINRKLKYRRASSWAPLADGARSHGFRLLTPAGREVSGTRRS